MGFVWIYPCISIPKKKSFFKLSLSTGASSDAILNGSQVGQNYRGGSDDAFGYDDGSRGLPEAIRNVRASGRGIKLFSEDERFDYL